MTAVFWGVLGCLVVTCLLVAKHWWAQLLATSPTANKAHLKKHFHRKLINAVALALSLSAMAFGLFWLAWILIETIRLGLGGLSWAIFTEMTPAPMDEVGGLANAIYGSVVMVALATFVGAPDWCDGGYLFGGVRPEEPVGPNGQVRQRHSFVGAFHRDRPLCLHRGGVAHEGGVWVCGRGVAVRYCGPRRASHH